MNVCKQLQVYADGDDGNQRLQRDQKDIKQWTGCHECHDVNGKLKGMYLDMWLHTTLFICMRSAVQILIL